MCWCLGQDLNRPRYWPSTSCSPYLLDPQLLHTCSIRSCLFPYLFDPQVLIENKADINQVLAHAQADML